MREYAPVGEDGEVQAVAETAEQLEAAGFDVRWVSHAGEEGVEEAEGVREVDEELFSRWVLTPQCELGSSVLAWWLGLEAPEEGEVGAVKASGRQSIGELFAIMRAQLEGGGRLGQGCSVTPELVVEWLQDESRMGAAFSVPGEPDPLVVVDQLWLELNMISSFLEQVDDTGVLERPPEVQGVEEQTRQVLEAVVHGYPGQAAEPTGPRRPGRLVRAFPLKFPMGTADPYDEERPREITLKDYVRHLLRYWTGHFVDGRDGHRVIWALVNSELVREAAGKGYAVHSVLMKRLRGTVVGGAVLTKRDLKRVMEDEEALRAMVNQLQIMGRDVRSTPMQWSYEKKKLDAAVKCLSWRPPWVRPLGDEGQSALERAFMEADYCVKDDLGLGRIPSRGAR